MTDVGTPNPRQVPAQTRTGSRNNHRTLFRFRSQASAPLHCPVLHFACILLTSHLHGRQRTRSCDGSLIEYHTSFITTNDLCRRGLAILFPVCIFRAPVSLYPLLFMDLLHDVMGGEQNGKRQNTLTVQTIFWTSAFAGII